MEMKTKKKEIKLIKNNYLFGTTKMVHCVKLKKINQISNLSKY